MSLNAWKLEVCSAASAASSSVPSETPVASAPPPDEQCRHQLQDAHAYQRRPPRSTLSLQLQRLEDLASVFPEAAGNNGRSSHDRGGGSDRDELHALVGAREEEEEEEEPTISSAEIEEEYGRGGRGVGSRGGGGKRSHPPLPSASLQSSFISSITPDLPRGPLEPLILSSPGDPTVDEVPASINCRLLEHQREGVKFLYNLYKKNNGGILGDDMGLGKTIQAIAFLAAVIGKDTEKEIYQSGDTRGHSKERGPILIVCPTSVIHNWGNEFSEWGNFSFSVYHGPNRDLILEKVVSQSVDILITSFDTFRIHDKILCDIQWDIVIIDEAHRLKNEKSQLYRACLGIKTRRRFGLTGTIMQNKILELFNLFDWVSPGSLGTREHFRDFYDEPLKHGQRLSAPERFVQIADERKRHLSSVLNKYLLRRTKEETIGHLMLGKEDNIVFCAMSDLQKRVYRRMLSQHEIQCLINKDLPCTCGSPLKQAECCKRIVPDGVLWSYLHRDNPEGCESCPFCLVLPCIIKLQQISNHLELIKPNPKDDPVKQTKDAELAAAVFGTDVGLVGGSAQSESFMELSDVEHCGKMRALEKLIFLWIQHGDKILLFSYSVRMMDILEKFLIRRGFSFSRLDGSTPMSLRQSLVDEFNRSPSKQVFLISTRAGGLGLNLVSANRVVIFDPNWNPAQDLQAQDRSFRYGQKRHVVVFRLLAAGSVEELVYSRQVYKQQLSNIAVSGKMEKRYFEGVQDCKEFKGELFGICNLFRDLSDKLFTRKRIELCENDAQDSYFDANGEATAAAHVSLSDADNLPKLEDLGILYSHRNEDIVNMRPNSPLKEGDVQFIAKGDIATTSTKTTSLWKSRKTRTVCGKSRPSLDERKRSEYALIAQFKGMEVMEFSRWLLSATPVELEELLRNYKSSKFKQCSSNNG